MMGYLFLAVALTAGLIKGLSGRKISKDVESLKDGLFVNMVRTAFCASIGLILVWIRNESLVLTLPAFLVCGLSAGSMAAFCISWLYAYKSEAYMFLNIFTMLGSVLTGLGGLLVYDETISPMRWYGMLLLLVAVYIMSLYNNKLTGKITGRGAVTLIVGGLGVAVADFMQKVFMHSAFGSAFTFSFYTYFIALLPQLVIWLVIRNKGKSSRNRILSDRPHMTIYLIMSGCLFLNSLAKTLAAGYLPASQMYPLLQGANLICSAVLAQIFLNEKITGKSVLGISCALCAVILMNI